MPRQSRNVYDHAIRMTGVKMISPATREEFLAALGPHTAMVALLGEAMDQHPMRLGEITEAAHKRGIPVIVDEVTTLTGPGELIDVVVTERGIAINPRRQDLIDAVKGSSLPIRPIQDIKAEVERICGGKPARPKLGDNPVAVVKWIDGTVLDTVWQVG